MIAPITTYEPTYHVENTSVSNGLSRVFAAAVVNRQFCDLLLQDPQEALQNGYLGEDFPLSREERDLIVSISANSLTDLAQQVTRSLGNQY